MKTITLCIILSIMAYNNQLLAGPDIDPIDDVLACSYYVLPDITGSEITTDLGVSVLK